MKKLLLLLISLLCLTSCSLFGANSLYGGEAAKKEFNEHIKNFNFPEGFEVQVPEYYNEDAMFQNGIGEADCINTWIHAWIYEYYSNASTNPDKAANALNELEEGYSKYIEKSAYFDQNYKEYISGEISKAKLGDLSAFSEFLGIY